MTRPQPGCNRPESGAADHGGMALGSGAPGGRDVSWTCASCSGRNPAGTRFCGHCGTAATPGPGTQEQRLVTALFADLSGFTSLADRLDAEALHEVVSPVISLLAGIAERLGGTVAKYAGDAVLVFFGAPTAQEDHARRALECALQMHEQLASCLPRFGPQARNLELHIGINSGRVVAGLFGGDIRTDYSILGDAVNVAQRLESQAPAGETYVGALTCELAGADFRVEGMGELSLKGKAHPVAAWRLLGRTVALQRASSAPASGLFGRDAELRSIDALLHRLVDQGGALAITAEPGAGKSRLTDEVQRRAGASGYAWLEARSISYGASVAYWPFVDLLRHSFAITIDQDPVDGSCRLGAALQDLGLPEVGPYFARLLGLPDPPGGRHLGELSPEAFHRELDAAVTRWISVLAAARPVVLVVEDVHWADSSSLDLLESLARLTGETRMLLYLTGRPEAAPTVSGLLAASRSPHRLLLPLGLLDRGATAALVTETLGGPAGPELVELVLERTGGNPFFTQELLRSVRDAGSLVLSPDGWHASEDGAGAMPATVEGVLAARIDQLPRRAAQVLQVASVIGRRVDLRLLEEAAGAGPDLDEVLGELAGAGFIDGRPGSDDRYVMFHHALVVDAAYGRLLRRQRRDLHRRVAEAAEVLYGTGDDVIDLLARHLYLAEAGVKAVDYLERAAQRARELFANDQAAMHLHRGLELARRTGRLASRVPGLLLDAAAVEEQSGQYDEAARDFAEALATTSSVAAWRGLAAVLRRWGRPGDALALIDRALASDDVQGQDVAPLWLERTATLVGEGRLVEAVDSALSGLAATDDHDTPVRGQLLARLARAQEVLDNPEEALAHALRSQEIFNRIGDLRGLALALRVTGGVQRRLGRYEDAATTASRGLELAEMTGSAEEIGGCCINLGLACLDLGKLAEGIECDRRAIAIFERMGHAAAAAIAHANLAEKLHLDGDMDGTLSHAARAQELAGEFGDTCVIGDTHRTIARVRADQERHREVWVEAAKATQLFIEAGDRTSAAECLDLVASALERMGQRERAHETRSCARSLLAG